jgi:glycine dehydrogenase subunit 1
MLATVGVSSVEDLFADIPGHLRLDGALDLEPGKSELEVYEELRALARRNTSTEDELCFLGAGMYDHYVPALIDSITARSEFLTPYTPYQPEVSQGGLQAMFEYQTAICELTGQRSRPVRRLPRRASPCPRGAGHAGTRLGHGGHRGAPARRRHRAARA